MFVAACEALSFSGSEASTTTPASTTDGATPTPMDEVF